MEGTMRRDELLRMAQQRGYVNTAEAARTFSVDNSTIRRDLEKLAHLGLLERSHGGGVLARTESELPYDLKMAKRVREKQAIGHLVAAHVSNGATVMIDSGSTALMVARGLSQHEGLTVITPDIRVAAEFLPRPDTRLIIPGGEVLSGTATTLSQEALLTTRRYHVDIAVICTDAVDESGISNLNGAVVPLKRAMIESARHTILAVDHSKIGNRKLVHVASLHELDQLVTDSGSENMALESYPIPFVSAKLEPEGT